MSPFQVGLNLVVGRMLIMLTFMPLLCGMVQFLLLKAKETEEPYQWVDEKYCKQAYVVYYFEHFLNITNDS